LQISDRLPGAEIKTVVCRKDAKIGKQMSEVAKRFAPTYRTYRELFLKSGNVCAFPSCDALMMDEEGNFIGQICHIEAAEPGGARFNPSMTNEERRSFANLMLLCYEHHVVTNDVERFSVAVLQEMKAAHEKCFSQPTRALDERLARIKWQSLVAAGVLSGITVPEVAHRIRSFLDLIIHHSDDTAPASLRELLRQRLCYIPSGVVYFYARDPAHVAVGEQLLEVLSSAGWRVVRLEEAPSWANEKRIDLDNGMLMAFEVADKHQIENTRQAIGEFLAMCGFGSPDNDDDVVGSDRQTIKVYIPFLVHRRFYVPYAPRAAEDDR
jgi:hypothetical protein